MFVRDSKSMTGPSTLFDRRSYISFAEIVRARIGGNLAERCRHIDGIGARNLTSDPDLGRRPIRFVGDHADPDSVLIHEDDVNECISRFRRHDRAGD